MPSWKSVIPAFGENEKNGHDPGTTNQPLFSHGGIKELTDFSPLANIDTASRRVQGKGVFLKKAFYLIGGFIFLFGCGGLPSRVNEPASCFSQLLPVSVAPLPGNPEFSSSDFLHSAEPSIPTETTDLGGSSADLFDTDAQEELFSLSLFLDNESTHRQCLVHGRELFPIPEGMTTEDNSLWMAERTGVYELGKTFQAFDLGTDPQPKTPADKGAEIILNAIYEGSVDLTSPEDFCEASSHLPAGFDPLDKASGSILPMEQVSFLSTAQSNKLPAAISTTFPSLSHEKVEETIGFFQTKADSFFARALGRSQAYEDMMKKILREKNLPEEFFYLALIESGYDPQAFSRAKASGIWQFITKTARRFGLKVDKWVDERRDPEKSTYAAAEYLSSLYEIFNNWDLVAASYNAGEGKILRAMKKTKSQDFWEISRHRYLRKETKNYVPMFLAAVLIASEPQKYGFSNIDYHPPLLYEKVMVPAGTRLDLIAKAAETDLSEIKALNPALKKEKTPPNISQFEIKLPLGKKDIFERNFPLINQKAISKGKKHSIRPGETLSAIAKKYRVRLQDLCQANNLSRQDRIKPGSTLFVPR
jgi:hypothetical protein